MLSDAALSATLFPGTETDLAFREHLLGRPSHVVTYPHRTYAEFPLTEDQNGVLVWNGASQPAVHYEFYSYNTEGQPAWQLQQFNANGITTDARGLTVRLDYANYDLMGNLRTVNVDVNHDMQLDMQQHYVYDAWGRLKDVYLNLGDDTDSGERIASYTYDDALGLMTSTKYHRSPCDVPGQNEVIEVTTNTYDVRDRLTGITGNRYAETLYYDGALPVHPVAGTLQGDQHYNGAINGLQHAYMLQGLTGYQDGIMDLPTKQAFRYDGLGRMTHTDAVVGDLVAGITDPTNSRFELGNERYNFDRSGNLTWMRRIGLFDQGNTANQMVDWIYQYNAGKNQLRKVLASSSSAMPSRDYTYDPLGNLLTDSYRRIGDSRYGRANMPFRVEQDQDGTLYASDYLYGPTDQRIYKRYGKVGGDVEVQEFNLMDAAGRVLGVLDMNGGINNGDGPMGAWTWYAFGNQRFAKVTPPTTQQPSYFTSDLAKKQHADPDNVKYQTVVDFLVLQNLQPEGIQYPLRTVLIQTTTNGYTMYTEAAYDIAKYTDPGLVDRPQTWYTFETAQKSLPLKRHTSEEEVYVHAADYYPYGSILREMVHTTEEKYLSTHHQRDQETGLDYRGARYYDSDVARFLSLDPLAAKYASWSAYNYVLGNPIS
ncbi:MAG: hypothetical protein IPO56_10800 [Flavobacteriales bacterium]|nr:hypothetical protein [Flavobacteriales bacterium]